MNTESVTGNPISLIFPRSSSVDQLLAVLLDVQSFFSKWPAPPEIFVPFLPPKSRFSSKGLTLLNNAGLGYGAAIKEGLKRSKADFSFVLDLPLEFPLADVFKSWVEFESRPDVDIIVGSRRLPDSSQMWQPPRWYWKIDSWLNERLHNTVGSPVLDITTSFHAYRVEKVRALSEEVREMKYSFGPKLINRAQQSRLGISEKPAHWNPSRESWARTARDQWSLLKLTFIENS